MLSETVSCYRDGKVGYENGKKNISECSLGDAPTYLLVTCLGDVSSRRGDGGSVLSWPSVLASLLQAQPDHLAFPLVSYCAPPFQVYDSLTVVGYLVCDKFHLRDEFKRCGTFIPDRGRGDRTRALLTVQRRIWSVSCGITT